MPLALLFGSVIGMALGLLGGGGSTLAVPLLAYGIGMEPREAIATALVVVGLAASTGALRSLKGGMVDLRIALTFGLVGTLGSAAGAQLARFLAPPLQMTLFAITMILAAATMLRKSKAAPQGTPNTTGRSSPAISIVAFGVGLLTGIVGVGGGFIVVPVLISVFGLPVRRAMGTSLLVIALTSAGGVFSYASYVSLSPEILLPFTAAAMLTASAGISLARMLDEGRLRSAFAFGLILLGLFTITIEAIVR